MTNEARDQTSQGHAQPIHNLAAEQGLLGAVLFDNSVFGRLPRLRDADFFDPVHQRLWGAIVTLIQAGRLADATTLRDHVAKDGGLAEIGGASYILTLLENAARLSAHAIEYAEIIRGLALRRNLARVGDRLHTAALQGDRPPEQLALEAEATLSRIAAAGDENAWQAIGEAASMAVRAARAGRTRGLSTGLPQLDDMINGFGPSRLIALGGATSMGKSIMGLQFAINVAQRGYGVAYFSLEMDADELALRLGANLSFDRARWEASPTMRNPAYLSASRGALSHEQWMMMERGAEMAARLPLMIDDRPNQTAADIEIAARRLFAKFRKQSIKPGLVVVDHEGLISAERHFPSELEAARARASALALMARRLKTPVIVLTQLTKDGSLSDGSFRLPNMGDFAYGSALSQAAHVAILIHRKAYYAERKPRENRTAEDMELARSREVTILVDKARGGRRGQFTALMDVASAVVIAQNGVIE